MMLIAFVTETHKSADDPSRGGKLRRQTKVTKAGHSQAYWTKTAPEQTSFSFADHVDRGATHVEHPNGAMMEPGTLHHEDEAAGAARLAHRRILDALEDVGPEWRALVDGPVEGVALPQPTADRRAAMYRLLTGLEGVNHATDPKLLNALADTLYAWREYDYGQAGLPRDDFAAMGEVEARMRDLGYNPTRHAESLGDRSATRSLPPPIWLPSPAADPFGHAAGVQRAIRERKIGAERLRAEWARFREAMPGIRAWLGKHSLQQIAQFSGIAQSYANRDGHIREAMNRLIRAYHPDGGARVGGGVLDAVDEAVHGVQEHHLRPHASLPGAEAHELADKIVDLNAQLHARGAQVDADAHRRALSGTHQTAMAALRQQHAELERTLRLKKAEHRPKIGQAIDGAHHVEGLQEPGDRIDAGGYAYYRHADGSWRRGKPGELPDVTSYDDKAVTKAAAAGGRFAGTHRVRRGRGFGERPSLAPTAENIDHASNAGQKVWGHSIERDGDAFTVTDERGVASSHPTAKDAADAIDSGYPSHHPSASAVKRPAPAAVDHSQKASYGDATVHPGHHSQKGHPIWTVAFDTRVDKSTFGGRMEDARSRGGNYSSYSGKDARPGFVFRDGPAAHAFAKAHGGK